MINFYAGIDPVNESDFKDILSTMNGCNDNRYHVDIVGEYDDPDGYYTYMLRGGSESYNYFLCLRGGPKHCRVVMSLSIDDDV